MPNEWLEVKRSRPSPQAEVFSSPEGKKGEKGYRLQGQMNIFSTASLMNLLKPLTSICEPCSVSRKDFVGLEFKADSLIFFGNPCGRILSYCKNWPNPCQEIFLEIFFCHDPLLSPLAQGKEVQLSPSGLPPSPV